MCSAQDSSLKFLCWSSGRTFPQEAQICVCKPGEGIAVRGALSRPHATPCTPVAPPHAWTAPYMTMCEGNVAVVIAICGSLERQHINSQARWVKLEGLSQNGYGNKKQKLQNVYISRM